MSGKLHQGYLDYLERKEKKIIFKLFSYKISHGHLSCYVRVLKGLLLGFAIGNLMAHNLIKIKEREPRLELGIRGVSFSWAHYMPQNPTMEIAASCLSRLATPARRVKIRKYV